MTGIKNCGVSEVRTDEGENSDPYSVTKILLVTVEEGNMAKACCFCFLILEMLHICTLFKTTYLT